MKKRELLPPAEACLGSIHVYQRIGPDSTRWSLIMELAGHAEETERHWIVKDRLDEAQAADMVGYTGVVVDRLLRRWGGVQGLPGD